jgi:hypothetical protein
MRASAYERMPAQEARVLSASAKQLRPTAEEKRPIEDEHF